MSNLVRLGGNGSFEIPDGSTKVPVDNYKTWLLCAGLPDTYGSLANVLASGAARSILCNNLNALRYMIRSTAVIAPAVLGNATWVAALVSSTYCVSIPTMTDFAAPSGVASATDTYNGYLAWWAFNKNTGASNYWMSALSAGTHALMYQFTANVWAFKMTIVNAGGEGIKNCKFRTSPDGANWTDITGNILVPNNMTLQEYVRTIFNSNQHNRIRIEGSDAYYADGRNAIIELNVYGLNLS